MNTIRYILSKYGFIIAIAVMIILFLSSATSQEQLDAYTTGESVYTVEQETEAPKTLDTFTYQNKTVNLTMEIPDGWTYVLKDGFDTYVHSASASSIQIQVLSYYPMVNNMTYESITQSYAARGMEVTEFSYLSDNSYYLIYTSNGMSGVTDYIETVLWDRSHVVKIVMTFNDLNYEKLEEQIWYCIDTIRWEYEDPIQEGFYLSYQSYGDFEYAVPSGWTTGTTENSFYACETTTGAVLTVNVLEDPSSISEITQVDYASFLSSGRSNFALATFETYENSIYGEATYANNESLMALFQMYIANGTYHYIVTYELPASYDANSMSIVREALFDTRVFYVTEASSETETESTVSESVVQTEKPMSETESITETVEDTSNVDTFADALMTVAEIPIEKAENIVNIWSTLNAGDPVYAEAYKGNDSELIILIQNSQSVNYFLYITKDGDLLKISVNTEDGPLIADYTDN